MSKRLHLYCIFRLLIVLLACGLVSLAPLPDAAPGHPLQGRWLAATLGVYLVFGLALHATRGRWSGPCWLRRWHVAGDVVIQTILVAGTGGALSIFSPLLFVTIAAATSVSTRRKALLLAAAAATALAWSSWPLLERTEVAASWRGLGFADARLSGRTHLVVNILALFVIAALGAHLSHGLRRIEGVQTQILENMAEGLIVVSLDGRVQHINREARALLGVPDGAPSPRTLSVLSLFPGVASRHLREAFNRTGHERIRADVSVPGRPPVPVEVKLSSVGGDGEWPQCRIAILSDLSLERQMEGASRRIRELEALQLLALGIAHEIRNPLASVRGCVQELARRPEHDAEARAYMDIVRRESDRLDSILEEFLQYARADAIEPVPVDAATLLSGAGELLRARPDIGARSVRCEPPSGSAKVQGDPSRLTQVLLNLGINAIQATRPEGGSIVLRARLLGPPDSPGVLFEVEDDGVGIEEADLERIYAPFFTRKAGGTGLGLSIVERIVREHKGWVDVSSRPGEGSVFKVWVPAGQPAAALRGSGAGTSPEARERLARAEVCNVA